MPFSVAGAPFTVTEKSAVYPSPSACQSSMRSVAGSPGIIDGTIDGSTDAGIYCRVTIFTPSSVAVHGMTISGRPSPPADRDEVRVVEQGEDPVGRRSAGSRSAGWAPTALLGSAVRWTAGCAPALIALAAAPPTIITGRSADATRHPACPAGFGGKRYGRDDRRTGNPAPDRTGTTNHLRPECIRVRSSAGLPEHRRVPPHHGRAAGGRDLTSTHGGSRRSPWTSRPRPTCSPGRPEVAAPPRAVGAVGPGGQQDLRGRRRARR